VLSRGRGSGSPRFPGDPSRAFASFQDPGRADDTSPKFRPPDIADFRDGNHWRFALGGADQYLSAFFDGQDVTV
jgi:hypothetical protein